MGWTTILETPYLKYEWAPTDEPNRVTVRRTIQHSAGSSRMHCVEETNETAALVRQMEQGKLRVPITGGSWIFDAVATVGEMFCVKYYSRRSKAISLVGHLQVSRWNVAYEAETSIIGSGRTWEEATQSAGYAAEDLLDTLRASIPRKV